jgi:GT2 family glycosyltransferase
MQARIAIVVAAWSGTPPEKAVSGLAPEFPGLFGEPCESIVVFNGPPTSDASSLDIDRWAALSENAGVARGWNIGWQLSLAEIVCFVNEDVRAEQNALRPLVEALDADPGLAAVGPRGARWDPEQLMHAAFVEPVEGHALPCDAISGYALAVRRDALREAGGFDERFSPAGGEEIDLCFALRSAGWKLGVVACPEVRHEWGISAESQRRRIEWIGGREALMDISARSRELLRAKWAGVDVDGGGNAAWVEPIRHNRMRRARRRIRHFVGAAQSWMIHRMQGRAR